jgi:hypothetical protein
VQLYVKLGKRIGLTIRQLGYPTKNALKTWYREYEQSHELRVGYTRRVGWSAGAAMTSTFLNRPGNHHHIVSLAGRLQPVYERQDPGLQNSAAFFPSLVLTTAASRFRPCAQYRLQWHARLG